LAFFVSFRPETTIAARHPLDSVRLTLSDAGMPLDVVNYDPWGTPESGTIPIFSFTGELQDVTTGLVNLRARWYHTGRGTFTAWSDFTTR
jgi:hypothetical protein